MASQDNYIRTALRVPPELHKAIHEAAALSNRTFNAEIVARLEKSFEGGGRSDEFSGDQFSAVYIMAVFARAALESVPASDDKNTEEARAIIKDVASKIIHGEKRSSEILMQFARLSSGFVYKAATSKELSHE